MTTKDDSVKFRSQCVNLRHAKAAVDVFQRISEKGPLTTVTLHVEGLGDRGVEDVASFDVPVGALNEFLSTCVQGVEVAETIVNVLEGIEKAARASSTGRLTEGYRAGDLA